MPIAPPHFSRRKELAMKQMIRLVASTILGTCILAGGRADAQVFENGPYYAYPSWDQQLPASTRFIVLTNWGSQAVLDRETGLVWERAPDASAANLWGFALEICRLSLTGGRGGWRLPTQEELATLLDPTQSNPPLPAGHPFQGIAAGDEFWTASTFEFGERNGLSSAYTARFSSAALAGNTFGDTSFDEHRRWCVRGGSSADNPIPHS
jgi:hypothetical protein